MSKTNNILNILLSLLTLILSLTIIVNHRLKIKKKAEKNIVTTMAVTSKLKDFPSMCVYKRIDKLSTEEQTEEFLNDSISLIETVLHDKNWKQSVKNLLSLLYDRGIGSQAKVCILSALVPEKIPEDDNAWFLCFCLGTRNTKYFYSKDWKENDVEYIENLIDILKRGRCYTKLGVVWAITEGLKTKEGKLICNEIIKRVDVESLVKVARRELETSA